MPSELPHQRGQIAIAGIGWLNELESFTATPVGDPEDLEAIEGTVGQLEPKGKRVEVSFVLFIPMQRHAYSTLFEYWYDFTRFGFVTRVGTKLIQAKGRINAPDFTDDGTRCNCTIRGTLTSRPKDI